MSESKAFALTTLVAIGWFLFHAADLWLTTINSDCTYAAGEICTRIARLQQQVVVFRGISGLLALVIFFRWIVKR